MLNLYSKGCEYAIRAITVVSRQESQDGFSVKAVCKKAQIPESFTRKVFQMLVKDGLLTARTGPGGCYRFARDPKKITLLDLIYAVDGKQAFDKCVIKDHRCDCTKQCALHPLWAKAKAGMIKEFEESSIAELMKS